MLLFIGIKEYILPSNRRRRMCDGKVPTKAFGQNREKIRGAYRKVKSGKHINHRQANIDL